jgi:soluble lytic murein transglycosylase-like protein
MIGKIFKNLFLTVSLLSSFSIVLSAQSAKPATANKAKPAKEALIQATQDYKESLNTLLSSYQASANESEAKARQLKELYDGGLISRKEFEASQATVSEAQAKVAATKKQIAEADLALTDTQKVPAPVAAEMAVRQGAVPFWTTGNKQYDSLIRQNGARFGVDPYLIYCVMQQESRFTSGAVSPKGAQGLMQLMPDTAARFGVTNSMDPAQNIMGGTRYLKTLLQMFNGRVDLALASYNAGEGAVLKYGKQIPPFKETQAYVRAIGTRYGQKVK